MSQIFLVSEVVDLPTTSKSKPIDFAEAVSVERLPTDPLFYADVTLQNVVVGSRYWIVPENDHSNVLATGVATQSEFTLSNLPAYSNPMLLLIRVRKASAPPYYKPLDTYANLIPGGVIVYIAQQEDE